jgi:hypothetical protein
VDFPRATTKLALARAGSGDFPGTRLRSLQTRQTVAGVLASAPMMPQLVQTMRDPNVGKKLAPLGAGQVLSVLPDMAVQS